MTEGRNESSPQHRTRFPEIIEDISANPSESIRSPMARSNELMRERIRNLRMSTMTDIVICICAIGISGCLIWWFLFAYS